jgi:hypothetical protein
VDTLPVRVSCYPDPDGDQKLLPLWEADSLTRFRDQACTSATREINAILTRLQEAKPSDAELSFITFQDRLFLIWPSTTWLGRMTKTRTLPQPSVSSCLHLSSRESLAFRQRSRFNYWVRV